MKFVDTICRALVTARRRLQRIAAAGRPSAAITCTFNRASVELDGSIDLRVPLWPRDGLERRICDAWNESPARVQLIGRMRVDRDEDTGRGCVVLDGNPLTGLCTKCHAPIDEPPAPGGRS